MMKVFYYYYYLFYTKVLPDNQPHATVIFTLGFTISLILNGILNIVLAYWFDVALNRWEMIGISIFVFLLLYLYYYKSGVGKRIVEIDRPKLLNSNYLSIFVTILLFLIGLLCLFVQADATRSILENK